ncbi:MAG: Crp/Fnr family transcriptional regulator [Cyclobacteriaceae bacterium]|nr:Crp/Fnr family transcriptional regulator [Cyclobacteriaceae bacterium]
MELTIFRDSRLLEEIRLNARVKTLDQDETLISPGEEVKGVPIILEGSIRIMRCDEDGREVFLYHLYPGQTCAMSINCCQAARGSMVRAVAEEPTRLLLVPPRLVDDWFRFPEWKAYINSTYGSRFAELLQVVDLIAFNHMDEQLIHYLTERARAKNSKVLTITHQEIADEMNTHREAISRLLRTLEQKNKVRLGRNTIELL